MGVEEARPQRSGEPLVQTGAIKVAPQPVDRDRDGGGGVRPVDADRDSPLLEPATDRGDGQDDRRGRGDVADHQQPGPRGDRRQQCVDHLGRIFEPGREAGDLQFGPNLSAPFAPDPQHRPVLVIIGQHHITRLQGEPLGDAVHGEGGVVDKREVASRRPDESPQLVAGPVELLLHFPQEKIHRVTGQPPRPLFARGGRDPGGRAERAMIEIGNSRTQVERLLPVGMRCGRSSGRCHGRANVS